MQRTTRGKERFRRPGAILVLVGLLSTVGLVMFSGILETGRMFVERNEMQTATDAAALAGSMTLSQGDTLHVATDAVAWAKRNFVLGHPAPLRTENVTCGTTDSLGTFTVQGHCGRTSNAVQVKLTDTTQYETGAVLHVSNVVLTTHAVVYLNPDVESSDCIKPMAVPYAVVTRMLQPSNTDTLRSLDKTDLERLQSWTPAQLAVCLKASSNGGCTGGGAPGNFGAVDISLGDRGAAAYRTNIATCNTDVLGPGNTRYTEPGNMAGPTNSGVRDWCSTFPQGMPCTMKIPLTVAVAPGDTADDGAVCKTNGGGRQCYKIKAIGMFVVTDDGMSQGNGAVGGYFTQMASWGKLGNTAGFMLRSTLVQ